MGGSRSGVCLVNNADGLVKRKRTFAAATALVQQKNKNIPINCKGMKEKMQVKNLKTEEKRGIALERAGRRTRNDILKDMSCVSLIMFLAAWATIDAETFIPALICVFCIAWLILFAIANNDDKGRDKKHG